MSSDDSNSVEKRPLGEIMEEQIRRRLNKISMRLQKQVDAIDEVDPESQTTDVHPVLPNKSKNSRTVGQDSD